MTALRLTVRLILRWADAHRRRTGRWPDSRSDPVAGAPGQSWEAVNRALARGGRGLPGGSSLARLLEEHRGRRNQAQAPPLDAGIILRWADAHFRRTGRWPREDGGPVGSAPGESWSAVSGALRQGLRGLPRGSLPRLLARRLGARNRADLPRLAERLGRTQNPMSLAVFRRFATPGFAEPPRNRAGSL
jgi:hypothetical protein